MRRSVFSSVTVESRQLKLDFYVEVNVIKLVVTPSTKITFLKSVIFCRSKPFNVKKRHSMSYLFEKTFTLFGYR